MLEGPAGEDGKALVVHLMDLPHPDWFKERHQARLRPLNRIPPLVHCSKGRPSLFKSKCPWFLT